MQVSEGKGGSSVPLRILLRLLLHLLGSAIPCLGLELDRNPITRLSANRYTLRNMSTVLSATLISMNMRFCTLPLFGYARLSIAQPSSRKRKRMNGMLLSFSWKGGADEGHGVVDNS